MSLYKLKMSLRFWRRTNREDVTGCAPISLRLTLNGRAELVTGVELPAAYWGGHKLRVQLPLLKKDRRPELNADKVDELNRRLQLLYDELDALRQVFRKRGRPYTAKEVAEAWRHGSPEQQKPFLLTELFDEFAVHVQRPSLHKAPATLQSYASRLANLRTFLREELKRPQLPASEVTMQTGVRLETWCQAQGHSELTMRKQVNMLQMVLAYGARYGRVLGNALHGYKYEAPVAPTLPISLPRADVAKLTEAVFTDMYLREIADMWLFMCYTGLSYVDYIRYATEPSTFTHRDEHGQDWIRMVRQKMARRKPEGFSVPILADAAELLQRRRWVLPRLDNAYANRKLKEISAELGLSVPLTCKVARATFSQLHRDQGVSGEAVAAMMGDTETVMNRHYSRIREERIARDLGLGVMFVSKVPAPPAATGTDGP